MCADYVRREQQLGAVVDVDPQGLPAFIADIGASTSKPPCDLWAIAEHLDGLDDRSEDDAYSARHGYRIFYGWMSTSAVHASLHAIKRFVRKENGQLVINTDVEPMTTGWPIPVGAAWLGELAHEVFRKFEVDATTLTATGIRLPTSSAGSC
jgi:hypothetical protein